MRNQLIQEAKFVAYTSNKICLDPCNVEIYATNSVVFERKIDKHVCSWMVFVYKCVCIAGIPASHAVFELPFVCLHFRRASIKESYALVTL